jgi:hypothetical protein
VQGTSVSRGGVDVKRSLDDIDDIDWFMSENTRREAALLAERERADVAERLLVRAREHIVGLVDGGMFRPECQCRVCQAVAFLREVGS